MGTRKNTSSDDVYIDLVVVALAIIAVAVMLIFVLPAIAFGIAYLQQKRGNRIVTFDPKTDERGGFFEGVDFIPVIGLPVGAFLVVVSFLIEQGNDVGYAFALLGWCSAGFASVYMAYDEVEFQISKRSHGDSKNDFVRETYQREASYLSTALVYAIALPQNTDWDENKALLLVQQLLERFDRLLFRIVADHESIKWQIVPLKEVQQSVFEQAVKAVYQEAELTTELLDQVGVDESFYRFISMYSEREPFYRPMKYVSEIKGFDPLVSISNALNGLERGDRISYTLVVAGFAPSAYDEGYEAITEVQDDMAFLKELFDKDSVHRVARFERKEQEIYAGKLRQPLYQCAFFIQIDSLSKSRIRQYAELAHSQISQFKNPDHNELWWENSRMSVSPVVVSTDHDYFLSSVVGKYLMWIADPRAIQDWKPLKLILVPTEIATLWHLPHKEMSASRIQWGSSMIAVPEEVIGNSDGVLLGEGEYQGRSVPIHLQHKDRDTHLNIVGKTGQGKSTFLHNLIHQDIASGHGVAVVDPHGDLVQRVLQASIPEGRENDVVILDLANRDYPPPINPMRIGGDEASLKQVVGIIERIFAGTASHARLSQTLNAAVSLLQADPEATMYDIARVLEDERYRFKLLKKTRIRSTISFFQKYGGRSDRMQEQLAEPIIHRISPFYDNQLLYPILCHPDMLDFHDLMKRKKIILLSLKVDPRSVSEQEKNLIGTLIVSQLQMAGMAGALDAFYIYIDEVQNFVTTSLDVMLSEARKNGLSLTIANQFLNQLGERTLEAVLGNVGTTVSFACSLNDARLLYKYMGENVTQQHLTGLDRYTMLVRMLAGGKAVQGFTVRASRPPETAIDVEGREAYLRELSIQNYTPKSRDDIFDWLEARYPLDLDEFSGSDETKTEIEDDDFSD